MSSAPLPTALALAALPALGAPLAGGTFAGVITQKDGQHVAVVLLPAQAEDVAWQAAMDWATEQGGQLPTRPMAALLFANVKPQLRERWHWTNETLDLGDDDDDDASYAWICDFSYGGQSYDLKSYEGCAVAVRCIPLSA
ncbi:MAG: DUF1566 domain-containing protein [Variovorax sp.]|nr:DUF1566 domain-containing protein [Variovorax sp.]